MQHDSTSSFSANQLAAARLIQACIDQGLHHFFVAPGSRCTPLTIAIANHAKARVVQHFDERGLAFACLGFARATGRAGVFVCTSGTAVANALPAVVEASNDQVPLLLLTADRPPELRETGANQTIDQVKIYGDFARWCFDLPCPTSDTTASFLRSTIRHAASRAATGPVHINCMFREPFESADAVRCESEPPATKNCRVTLEHVVKLPAGKTLVMAGSSSAEAARAAGNMADRLNAPFFSDVSNGVRGLAYDLALMSNELPVPDRVVHVGGRVVSKRWATFLKSHPEIRQIHYWPYESRLDPDHALPEVIHGDLKTLCDNTTCDNMSSHTPMATAFTRIWQTAAQIASAAAQGVVTARGLSEPCVAYELAQQLPNGAGLLLGNSLPIRQMDQLGFWPPDRQIHVATNRGASGIDGLLATAAGFAVGLGTTVTAFVGDLSALHDLNSLSLLARNPVPVVLVINNNDGGGIFHFLPIVEQTEHFEQYFGTPHGRNFRAAAALFDLPYESPQTVEQFRAAYDAAIRSGHSCVIEVRTKRAETLELHRQVESAVRAALQHAGSAGELA